MSPKVDLSGWPNIDQVSAVTGISRRTLERELAANKWQTQKRPRQGARPEVVFDPDQVAARMPAPPAVAVKAAPQVPATDTAITATMAETAESDMTMIAEIAAAVCQQVLAIIAPPQPQAQTTFVELNEASAISGLSKHCLRRLIGEGKLGHVPDRIGNRRLIKIRRAELDTFNLS